MLFCISVLPEQDQSIYGSRFNFDSMNIRQSTSGRYASYWNASVLFFYFSTKSFSSEGQMAFNFNLDYFATYVIIFNTCINNESSKFAASLIETVFHVKDYSVSIGLWNISTGFNTFQSLYLNGPSYEISQFGHIRERFGETRSVYWNEDFEFILSNLYMVIVHQPSHECKSKMWRQTH